MQVDDVLKGLTLGQDGIYGYGFENQAQSQEIEMRKVTATRHYDNYLEEVAHHHSIPVMDSEVRLFLKNIPLNGLIVDVGGCWGWHWRTIDKLRPDVRVFIVDFIRENLNHARQVLGPLVNHHVFLIHGDACSLVFADNTFDAYWTVQALQHIPNFTQAVKEAHRVLKPGGSFTNYSYNSASIIKVVLHFLGKSYHHEGQVSGLYYLSKASQEQIQIVEGTFRNTLSRRYSEIIYRPGMGLIFPAREKSVVGKIDALLSGPSRILSWVARQQSYHTTKV